MAFFRNFPVVDYHFGNEINSSLFQNITAYIDLIDEVSDDASMYEQYTIQDGDRPDIVSLNLYGTVDYYWSFFLLNDNLKMSGWPLSNTEILEKAKQFYPHITMMTDQNISIGGPWINSFIVTSLGANTEFKGKVLYKDMDLGQLVVKPIIEVRSVSVTEPGTGYTTLPQITAIGGGGEGATFAAVMDSDTIASITVVEPGDGYTSPPTIVIPAPTVPRGVQASATATISSNTIADGNVDTFSYRYGGQDQTLWGAPSDDVNNWATVNMKKVKDQHLAPHHYDSADGLRIDLEYTQNGGVDNITLAGLFGKTTVSNYDNLLTKNEELKQIKVFKPEVIADIDVEFQRLLRR